MTATYTCKTCLNSFSREAKFCPFCGAGVPVSQGQSQRSIAEQPRPATGSAESSNGAASSSPTLGNAREAMRRKRNRRTHSQERSEQTGQLQRVRRLVWSMVAVFAVMLVLVGIAFSHTQRKTSEPAVPESLVGLLELPSNRPNLAVRNGVVQAESLLRLTARINSFFLDWESNADATDEDWLQIAVATTDLTTIDTDNPEANARRAYAYAEVALGDGDLGSADSWYADASSYWPEWPLPVHGRGKVAELRRDHEAAARYFTSAINLSPNWLIPRSKLVSALLNLNRYNDAVNEARQILSRNQDSAFAHYALAMAYGQLNRQADAIRSAETALRLYRDRSNGFDPNELRQHIAWWHDWIERARGQSVVKINTGTVTSPDAYAELRTRPGITTGTEILRIPQNTVLTLQNCQNGVVSVRGQSGNWCQTSYGGQTGWVFNGFVK